MIAPSFSDIFRNNCTKNGLVPVVVPEATVEAIWAAIEADAETQIVVDMERLKVEVPAAGIDEGFPMDPQTQHRFLNGLDDVGITLTHADAIASYEANRPAWPISPAPISNGVAGVLRSSALTFVSAVVMIADFATAALHLGCACLTRAKTPATCGLDIEVPPMDWKSSPGTYPGSGNTEAPAGMLTPGAVMSA